MYIILRNSITGCRIDEQDLKIVMFFHRRLPEEGTAKVLFTHSVYKQLLEFMVVQGALLSHVEPKYLMSYDDYCVYCKSNTPSSKPIDAVS